MNTIEDIKNILSQAEKHNTDALRSFLTTNPEKPLIAVGSGGMVGVAQFVSLLYGAMSGLGRAMTPLEMNSLSDETLSRVKILLLSKGGHNNDIEFAAKRCLAVNPSGTACMCLYSGEKNKLRPLFAKAGASQRDFRFDCDVHDGFVSEGSPLMYFALFAKALGVLDQVNVKNIGVKFQTNAGTALCADDFKAVQHFSVLSAGWGSPVAELLEGKCVESGWASVQLSDYRNYCHGRFIFTSNHLENSAVVMLVTPREKALSERIRSFLPENTRLILVETLLDSPAASLQLLTGITLLFTELCRCAGVNPDSPKNPGKIDKRVPIWVPFVAELKKIGPLSARFAQKFLN